MEISFEKITKITLETLYIAVEIINSNLVYNLIDMEKRREQKLR